MKSLFGLALASLLLLEPVEALASTNWFGVCRCRATIHRTVGLIDLGSEVTELKGFATEPWFSTPETCEENMRYQCPRHCSIEGNARIGRGWKSVRSSKNLIVHGRFKLDDIQSSWACFPANKYPKHLPKEEQIHDVMPHPKWEPTGLVLYSVRQSPLSTVQPDALSVGDPFEKRKVPFQDFQRNLQRIFQHPDTPKWAWIAVGVTAVTYGGIKALETAGGPLVMEPFSTTIALGIVGAIAAQSGVDLSQTQMQERSDVEILRERNSHDTWSTTVRFKDETFLIEGNPEEVIIEKLD